MTSIERDLIIIWTAAQSIINTDKGKEAFREYIQGLGLNVDEAIADVEESVRRVRPAVRYIMEQSGQNN